jgi:translation initiation factor 1 (eIF-1/SUI1)
VQLLPIKANKKAINRTRLTAVNGIDPKQKNLKKKIKKVGKMSGF